jgi:4-amino-4-deoxy-L-arabinose transferase-like glycosyltransferase
MKSLTETKILTSRNDSRLDNSAIYHWQKIIPFSLVFLATCFILFANLGKFPLFNPDEALYAEPAREMLDTGEYITTLLNYKVRFTKPPLVIWAMALSYKVFGVNEFAARFFGATCGALLVAFTYLFIEKYSSRRKAIITSLLLTTAPLYVGVAREAITDMPLALFFAGSLMSFFHAYKQQSNKWLYLAYVLVGLSVMTKGPVGILLPALIMASFHVIQGNIKKTIAFYKPIYGLLIIAAIAIPWFAVEIIITKGAYYQEFLVRENFERFTSVVDSHKGGWWYHIVAMLGGFLPWSIFSVIGLIQFLSTVTKINKFKLPNLRIRQALKLWWQEPIVIWDTNKQLIIFAGLWTIITLIFFSVSVSKLISYTVPAFPALAFLTSYYIDKAFSENKRSVFSYPYIIFALTCAIVYSIAPFIASKAKNFPTHELLTTIRGFSSFELIVLMVAGIVLLFKKPLPSFALFFVLTTSCTLYFANRTANTLSYYWEEPLPQYANYARQSNWPIFVFDMRKPSIPFYCLRQVNQPSSRETLVESLKAIPSAYILTKANNKEYFATLPNCKILNAERNYILVAWQQNK